MIYSWLAFIAFLSDWEGEVLLQEAQRNEFMNLLHLVTKCVYKEETGLANLLWLDRS